MVNFNDDLAYDEISQDHCSELDDYIFDEHDDCGHGNSLEQKYHGVSFGREALEVSFVVQSIE